MGSLWGHSLTLRVVAVDPNRLEPRVAVTGTRLPRLKKLRAEYDRAEYEFGDCGGHLVIKSMPWRWVAWRPTHSYHPFLLGLVWDTLDVFWLGFDVLGLVWDITRWSKQIVWTIPRSILL